MILHGQRIAFQAAAFEATDTRRRAYREALRWQAQEQARIDALARAEQTPEERADALMRAAHGRMLTRPPLEAPQSVVQSWLDAHPHPCLAELDVAPEELRFTRAEVSLGEVLDALADDDPWLGRLERADLTDRYFARVKVLYAGGAA